MRTVKAPSSILSQVELEDLLERAAEEGARRALASVGLHDDRAAGDVRDLRGILDSWRDTRRAILRTFAQILTTGVLALLAAGAAWQVWLKGDK